MGRRDSSTKRKSFKKKRAKISSKKKSRRKEPKKRIYDSVTSNFTNDLLNSEHRSSSTSKSDHRRRINKNKKHHRDSSLSSYSGYESVSSDSDSDNTYKSRKARGSQVGLQDKKRRGRRRFTSPNGEVNAHIVRKRKRLDRDHVLKPIKKTSKKKSTKYSSSSSSSDSESCSICQSKSSDSTSDGLRQRSKVIPNKDIERLRGRDSHKGKKMQKVRTPSCFLSDRGIEPSVGISNGDESLLPTNNSRRLRSVIAVIDQSHDGVESRWEMDQHKVETVYDQNDYPSPKSVDSYEGGYRMESSNHSHGAFSNRICVENVAGEEVSELRKSRIDVGDLDKAGDHHLEGAQTNDSEKEKKIDVFVPEAASGGDILESILRKKALESLRKFQGRLQTDPRSTNVKINDDSDVGTVDIVQNKSIKEVSSIDQEINNSGLSSKGEFSLTKEVKELPDSAHFEKYPGMAKQSFVQPPKEVKKLSECSEEEKRAIACSSPVEPSSFVGPISGEHNLERGNEAEDGSHFQQKTMSVMRGGELVQVSYKVYIPKKAPAAARRQLRR